MIKYNSSLFFTLLQLVRGVWSPEPTISCTQRKVGGGFLAGLVGALYFPPQWCVGISPGASQTLFVERP